MDNLAAEPTPGVAAARMLLSVAATLFLLTAVSILAKPVTQDADIVTAGEVSIVGRVAPADLSLASVR